jgi:hypothetical protein
MIAGMRLHLPLLLTAAGLCVLAAPTASTAASGAKTIAIPLPAPQRSTVATFKVRVTAPAGKPVPTPRIRTVNESQLGNLAAVYAVKGAASAHGSTTFTVYVLLKRFTAARRLTTDAADEVVVSVEGGYGDPVSYPGLTSAASCFDIQRLDNLFEHGGVVNRGGDTYVLSSGRSRTVQPSPPEEVLDNIIAAIPSSGSICTDIKPEGDDPGNT